MRNGPYEAIVIGASAGAIEALSQILPVLPANYALPVLAVVHIPSDKKSLLAELLKAKCAIDVREAEDKEPLKGGIAYFAPPDYHLQVESGRYMSLSNDEPVLFSRPSIDVLFETAADAYRDKLMAVILTGASSDGALGLKAVMDAGGTGLVQSPQEALAPTLPMAALDQCPQAQAMSLKEITQYLLKAATP